MDDFFSYGQIKIPSYNHNTSFNCSWGMFSYRKLHFGLKNVGATFQSEMNYDFHDIKHMVQPYLDDFLAHSKYCKYHQIHLRVIFLHCRQYNVRINPHKCVFFVQSGRLIGFIVSKSGIRINPMKFQESLIFLLPLHLFNYKAFKGRLTLYEASFLTT